jgi:hypothetical protein
MLHARNSARIHGHAACAFQFLPRAGSRLTDPKKSGQIEAPLTIVKARIINWQKMESNDVICAVSAQHHLPR